MTDLLDALLAAGVLPQTSFGPDSRYYGVPVAQYAAPEGTVVRFVRRRFIPQVASFPTLVSHRVQRGDRIDVIAARYLGDPLLYWRIADANLAVRPSDPLILGNPVSIPLMAGAPGALP